MAQFLLSKGYVVYGTSRDHRKNSFENLKALGIYDDVNLMSMSFDNTTQVETALDSCFPDEIYNFASQSSVSRSFEFPDETIKSIVGGTHIFLDAILRTNHDTRFFNPASSEMFGNTPAPATEMTSLNPRSPYGEAKAEAMKLVIECRQDYGLFACSAITFNHESPFRPPTFVTRKIVKGAIAISKGEQKYLHLGNLDIIRDWGWAPEYVDAMWRMMQAEEAEDFVLATGQSSPLQEFVKVVFEVLGLEWEEHVVTDNSLLRHADIMESRGDPGKALALLGWKAETNLRQIAMQMIKAGTIRK